MEELQEFAKIAPYLKHPLVLVGFGLLLVFALHRGLIKSGIISPIGSRASSRTVQNLLHYSFVVTVLLILLGFWLTFQARYDASQQQMIEQAVKLYMSQCEAKLAATDQRPALFCEELGNVVADALRVLPRQTQITNARPRIEQALELASQGKTEEAEAIFKEVEINKKKEGSAANKEAAEAARRRGALALARDPKEALSAFQSAVELDPDNLETLG